jgi:DNA helicase MCM9
MATRSDLHCLLDASSELPSEYTRHFANYLQKNHQAEIEAILMELDAASSAHYSVSVNVLDLLQENLALGTLLLHHPQDLLERFDAALVVAQEQVMSNHDDVHFMAVKESAHARPHHLPRCRELWKETVSSIRAASINTLLSVSGTVIRTGQIKMLQSRREYRCVKCEHRFTLTADLEQRHQMPIPDECPSHNAKPCRGGKFEFVEGTEVCKDYQEVRIQEQIHRLTVGSIPRSITLILQDDLVDACSQVEDKPDTAWVPARPKRLTGRGSGQPGARSGAERGLWSASWPRSSATLVST